MKMKLEYTKKEIAKYAKNYRMTVEQYKGWVIGFINMKLEVKKPLKIEIIVR